ncbi:hypothetical protein L1987_56197 [Smallanthus sonchifolius]|uniref:Uncharacterized protein n=1 Tax=Smallanthus sonchifolius TaxID=185202 RepID=A0ACB9EC31_9ASTR|nr:hypothetical protein L1987_56197 [Smallanthus sonchifolius]
MSLLSKGDLIQIREVWGENLKEEFALIRDGKAFNLLGGMLARPEQTAWDQKVEYYAFAYQQYIAISSLIPQYRYLGDVAIPHATGVVWQQRQLFVATPTIEYMFDHAISLSHPGIRCCFLAAYGDAVSAVEWGSWLGREHHND